MFNDEVSVIEQTEDIILNISDRLSSRTEYRNCEYRVEIGEDFIHMQPLVRIFPNTHHRKASDKKTVLEYVVNDLHPDIALNKVVNDTVKVKPNTLYPGVYIYKLSPSKKRRKWIKVM